MKSLLSRGAVPRALRPRISTQLRMKSVKSSPARSTSSFALFGGILISGLATFGAYKFGQHQALLNIPADVFPQGSTTKLGDISPPTYCTDEELSTAIGEVKKTIGGHKVFNTPVEIESHGTSEFTTHAPKPHQRPKYVVYPELTEDVVSIMKILYEYNVPVVPFSGGTSLEGHFFSTRSQSVVVDTAKMKKVIAIHEDDLDAVVEAGVNWQDLNQLLEPHNLMFGPDCGPSALIGGMVSTNASGINAARYGSMVSNVVSLTVVLADGTVIKTKQRPRKSSAGYNLAGLIVGSEGTLGIVTEATVKLHVKPVKETVCVGQFATVSDATNAVAQIYRKGLNPNAIELLDKDMMHCINYSGYFTREWLEVPTIFFKIGGINDIVVKEQVKEIEKITSKNNCHDFLYAKNDEEKEELFSARKNAFFAILDYGRNEIDPNVRLWVTDMAVPLSKLPPVLAKLEKMVRNSGLQSILLGHVGDSNIHFDIFYTEETKNKCEKIINEMMLLGLANEGTSSGEHGIGNGKRRYLELELGTQTVDLMRRVKFALDPKRILNPDKIFKIDPEDDGEY